MNKFFKFIDNFERESPQIFWFLVICLGFWTAPSPKSPEIEFQDQSVMCTRSEKNICTTSSLERLVSGSIEFRCGATDPPTGSFIPNETVKGASDRGPDRNMPIPGPRLPFVGRNSFGFSGSGSVSGSGNNEIPEKENWVSDPNVWNDSQSKQDDDESEQSCLDFIQSGKIDFDYTLDESGNLILWVPNNSEILPKRPLFKVEFDQTCTHLHHAPELGIKLPKNFDMNYYENIRSREGKIQYAKEHVPIQTIIEYQNAIGNAMFPNSISVRGFAGKRKRSTELKIQMGKKDQHIISIIREDGLHISSHTVDDDKLRKIVDDGFWVLKDRDI